MTGDISTQLADFASRLVATTGLVLVATFLAGATTKIISAVITPIFDKFKWDKFILMYVGLILGGTLSFLCNMNLFEYVIPTMPVLMGKILSAVIIGGGSNLIHDIFNSDASKTSSKQ